MVNSHQSSSTATANFSKKKKKKKKKKTENHREDLRETLDVALSSLLLPERPKANVFIRLLCWDDGDEASDEDENNAQAIDDDKPSQGPESVTQLCLNLFVFDSTTGIFRFAHSSVQEYLLEHMQGYYASEDLNHVRVAEHCVSILLRTRHRTPENAKELPEAGSEKEIELEPPDATNQSSAVRNTGKGPWYFRRPSASEQTEEDKMMYWVRTYWAYFVLNSRERHHLLEKPEADLQEMIAKQKWESVSPRIFFSACYNGLMSFARTRIEAHPQFVDIRQLPRTEKKSSLIYATGLQWACLGGYKEILEVLLETGARIDYYSEGSTKTNALCIALRQGNYAMTQLFLIRGASPNTESDAHVPNPLHWVTWNWKQNMLSIVQALIDHGADINAEVNNGETPVSRAVVRENIEVLEFLLKKGAKITISKSEGNVTTILHYITKIRTTPEKSLAMAKLIIRHGVDVDIRSFYQLTALLAAAYLGNVKALRLSCQNRASVDARDSLGRTPLVEALSQMQALPYKQVGKANDTSEAKVVTAWNASIASDNNANFELVVRVLIGHGADVKIPSNGGWRPLNVAASKGLENISKLLLLHEADVHATDNEGWTMLQRASRSGYADIVKLLLAYEAKIHTP